MKINRIKKDGNRAGKIGFHRESNRTETGQISGLECVNRTNLSGSIQK